MDHPFKQRLQTLRESINLCNLKMAMSFTFTASIIFIILSYSSLTSILLNFSRVYLSTLTLLNRNYMFFLSNVILALVVKNSGLITNASLENDDNGVREVHYTDKSGGSESGLSVNVEKVAMEEEEQHGIGNGVLITIDEDAATENTQEEKELKDGGIRFLSTEELNRKCDEFIKMMKGDIKIEAQKLTTV